MEFRILGPLEVRADGRSVALGGLKPRAILALLLLHPNEPVNAERLLLALWGRDAPPAALKRLHVHVSRLRKALGDGELVALTPAGYRVRVRPDELDAERFEQLAEAGRRALAAGEPENAADLLRQALALWRGPAFADLAFESFAQPEIARLGEQRLAAVEARLDADLACDRNAELVAELRGLVAEHPLRERLHGQLMLALYRAGRQADALEAFHHARRSLVEELGVEPSPDLQNLHRAILRHDPSLHVRPAELPRELDVSAATAMLGRERELAWLSERWKRARAGHGEVVGLIAGHGMGKTRLAAELAGQLHKRGATVLYATGWQATETIAKSLRRARDAARPTLLVIDDADANDATIAAIRRMAGELAGTPSLALATVQEPDAPARLGCDASLPLGPLDADAVRAVALQYAASEPAADVPVDELLEDSGGVPGRLHELARAWARQRAERRVAAMSRQAEAGRGALRSVEAELARGVADLQVVRERTAAPFDDDAPVVCPFKGLAAFDLADAKYYCGREQLVAELVAKLVGASLVGVVGPSGSGKSSLVRAGLLPALAGGVLPGSDTWPQVLVRPGAHPLQELRRAQTGLEAQRPAVLVVDQFEEVFTACRDEPQRHAFIDALARAAGEPARGTVVVLVVRADFYGCCARYPALSRLLGSNHVLVGPMQRDELRRAIELPAARAGLQVEPELSDALIADIADEPGGLPLLSTSLLELWQARDDQRLRLAAYKRVGGVHGAVARLAERTYERLDGSERGIARTILLRLAGDGEGDAAVRARVALREFPEEARRVLTELTDGRLLTVGDGDVEVAHEALLREWPRLRGWLEEDAHGRRLHRHLRAAAQEWHAGGRDRSELYRGARLASALDWAGGHNLELTPSERAFLDTSRAASGRAQRRLRLTLAGVACLLALAVFAALYALDERGNARAGATVAIAQRLGAQALTEPNLDRSLLLARQGVALHDSAQTRSNLLAALLKSPAAIGVIREDSGQLTGLDLSPDQRTLAFIDDDSMLHFKDTRTRRVATGPQVVGAWSGALRFSDDGSRLAVAADPSIIMDARTHRVLARLRTIPGRLTYGLSFSPDGHTLYAAIATPRVMTGVFDATDDGQLPANGTSIVRFDARNGRQLGAKRSVTRGPAVVALMLTRDGRRLVTSVHDGPTVVRDARTLRPLRRLPLGAGQTALTADDHTLLVGGHDGSVRFLDLITGTLRRASGRHEGTVVRAAFSGDGRTAITAGKDNRLIVWNVKHAAAEETLEGHAGQITGLAISSDKQTVYTSALDGKVISWNLAGAQRLGRPFDVGPDDAADSPVHALRSDGRVLAVGHRDGTVTLTDTQTLEPLASFRAVTKGPVSAIGYVPGSRLLAVGGDDSFLAIVDERRGTLVKQLNGHSGTLCHLSFSADGRVMVTASTGAEGVLVWSLHSGRPLGNSRGVDPWRSGPPSLSPDGRTLTIATSYGIEIIDVATLQHRALLPDTTTVGSVSFTADGRFLVGGSYQGWARLWSTKSWRPASRRLPGHAGPILGQSTSPDGRILATGGADGAIRLFDLRTQQPLGAPLPGVRNRAVVPEFSPDGAFLFAITSTGRAYRWDMRPSSWARRACDIAGRTLTRTEWRTALPDRHYAPACKNQVSTG
jgi:DNA-binding SARP family transcriptional activator/WD40 repeat protein/energy-coupling factor transporter ATP-binding protein EcfA2